MSDLSQMSDRGSDNPSAKYHNHQNDIKSVDHVKAPVKTENDLPNPDSIAQTSKKRSHDSDLNSNGVNAAPNVKRRRVTEIPIWAQQCRKANPLRKYQAKKVVNGASAAPQVVRQAPPPLSVPLPTQEDNILGHWDPTFTTVIPHEELTRVMCDFLFQHVVCDKTLQTRSTGGPSSAQGLLEIEARLGTIVRKGEHRRLVLPIKTECVLEDVGDVAFESMMTAVSLSRAWAPPLPLTTLSTATTSSIQRPPQRCRQTIPRSQSSRPLGSSSPQKAQHSCIRAHART